MNKPPREIYPQFRNLQEDWAVMLCPTSGTFEGHHPDAAIFDSSTAHFVAEAAQDSHGLPGGPWIAGSQQHENGYVVWINNDLGRQYVRDIYTQD